LLLRLQKEKPERLRLRSLLEVNSACASKEGESEEKICTIGQAQLFFKS
jgi:hypothetical protein